MHTSIEIKTLTDTPQEEIYQAFTEAFRNYVIPITFNQEATLGRWDLAGVRYDLSFGAFHGPHLVAFVLHTSSGNTLYNFGTGVIPEYRGRHLIEALYKHIDQVPDYEKYVLEVIRENYKAHELYKKMGFIEMRKLHSFQGELTIQVEEDKGGSYSILPVQYNEEHLRLRLFEPTFENSSKTTLQNPQFYELHEIRENSSLKAYAIYCPTQLALKEIGVSNNLEESLDQLFIKMKLNQVKLRIMNIDEGAQFFQEYLMTRGLVKLVSQYEMIRTR